MESASQLKTQAQDWLRNVAEELKEASADVPYKISFFADGASDGSDRSHYFRRQIVEAARTQD